MTIRNELIYDFDIGRPKIILGSNIAIIENVKRIILIEEDSITVGTGSYFVSITGKAFVIDEIWEGRMLIEGEIQEIQFYKAQSKNKD